MIQANKLLTVALISLSLAACGGQLEVLNDDSRHEALVDSPEYEGSTEVPEEVKEIQDEEENNQAQEENPTTELSEEELVLQKYDHLDPQRVVPTAALKKAVLYYDQHKSKFKNKKVMSLIDFSQSSSKKRWHFIDMDSGEVFSLHVSHGKGSDSNHDGYAEKFSNVSGSNASSLGFYLTAETYNGSNGYSLRLDGLSSTNSRARSRAIVVHGASYVKDSSVIQGRSWGCPAVSHANRDRVINLIKGGSLIYAFN